VSTLIPIHSIAAVPNFTPASIEEKEVLFGKEQSVPGERGVLK
jgi:hypothetical protein